MNIKINNYSLQQSMMIALFVLNISSGQSLHERRSYPVPGNSFIGKYLKDNGIDYQKPTPQTLLKKTSSWNFKVGSTFKWSAIDGSKGISYIYTVNSTCRKVGTHCYIFVEDSIWASGKVNQIAVDSVENAWDFKTPANPNKGIYQTDVETFGNPPDVDNDSLIVILILNILDGYKGYGSYVGGYYYSGFETSDNNAEILFIDANPQNLNSSEGLQDAMSVTAHEFQHMIEYKYNKDNQINFFNEGCSLIAQYINGYSLYDQSYFINEPNQYLLEWRTYDNIKVVYDYSRAARFFLYLKEQFFDTNQNFFKNMVTSGIIGVAGLNQTLSAVSPTRKFNNIVQDWFTANYINDYNIDPKWGYKYKGLSKVATNIQLLPNNPITTSKVYPLAAQYISFMNGQNLAVKFSGVNNSNILIRKFNISPGKISVEESSTINNTFSIPNSDNGIALNNYVTFMIYDSTSNLNGNRVISSDFSYMSTGITGNQPFQLMYDQTEPTAAEYPLLVGGDSIAVIFDSVNIAGAKLDSIKVALRQAGSLSGNIYRYSGSNVPTPIGKLLTPNPITATSNIAIRPTSNYPVPWNNWVKVNLIPLNIDATGGFVVSFGMNGLYTDSQSSDNRIMITKKPFVSSYHSYEKLKNARNGFANNQWHTAVDIYSSVVITYLIRAYISFNVTGVQKTLELMPEIYKLEQNYPNPFNPITVIQYQIPNRSVVSLKLFDVLGKEIRALVNGEQQTGDYSVTFDGSNLSSGVYFYQLQAGDFMQTRKLLLMK